MLKEIKKFIDERETGLFLLSSPTGFGKTTAVINYIDGLLKNNDKLDYKIFFVTNLKANLPHDDLKKIIGSDAFYKRCLNLESIVDPVIRNFSEKIIKNKEIVESKEFKELKNDIDIYKSVAGENDSFEEEDKEIVSDEKVRLTKDKRILKFIKEKILKETEPAFRKMIKQTYFFEKSSSQKNEFISENPWLKKLYPAIELEKKEVVFLTTKKLTLPIDTFTRLPYYLYQDSISNNAIFFIDEFDSTKKVFLNTIIDKELDVKVDSLKLFLEIFGSLKNIKLPKILNNPSKYSTIKKQGNPNWYYPLEILELITKRFEDFFNENGIKYLFKSKEIVKSKAFLFYDGKNLTISDDKAKTYFTYSKDEESFYNNIRKEFLKNFNSNNNLNIFINKLESLINYFVNGILMIAINYMHFKMETLEKDDVKYSLQDSIYTVLNAFNISNEFEDVLFQKAIDSNFYNFGKVNGAYTDEDDAKDLSKEEKIANDFYYKGFYFTEVKDDSRHDLQSKFHTYTFSTTPESIIVGLAGIAKVVGISATAKIDTVIGNYDVNFFKKQGNIYYDLSEEGKKRIEKSFDEHQRVYEKENIKINVSIVDDYQEIGHSKNTEMLIDEVFESADLKEHYKSDLESSKNSYYDFTMFKLVKVYKEFIKNENIKSFISFINFGMGRKSKITTDRFFKILKELCNDLNVVFVEPTIINSENFISKYNESVNALNNGNRIFIITTYQTIGSGKNIQYKIPSIDNIKNNIYIEDEVRYEKDFDGIYISTPTHLMQNLSYLSENKYYSLAKYLYGQKYLNSAKKLHRNTMISNIANAFKIIFYNGPFNLQNYTDDINYYTAQIAIQAIGRICRCRNKNKNIYIFTDDELLKRIQTVSGEISENLLNREFKSLLNYNRRKSDTSELYKNLSTANVRSFSRISIQSNIVRASLSNIKEWKEMREYALKNPTTSKPSDKYQEHYFNFEEECSFYSFNKEGNRNFSDIGINTLINKNSVSDIESGLKVLMKIDFIKKIFTRKGYATSFSKNDYILNESFYKQVYKGALGEVVGKAILDEYLGLKIKELDISKYYEYFDYEYDGIYFDFKNWNYYEKNRNSEIAKIKNKLSKLGGRGCFIINLFKRDNSTPIEDLEGKVFEIQYLIDPETNEISMDNIDFIAKKILSLGR